MLRRLTTSLTVAASLSLGACSASSASQGEPFAAPPPEALATLVERLRAEGVTVARSERLRSHRELPECPEAAFRYRLHLQDGDFVNVSRFGGPEEAERCLAAYRTMIGKAGSSGFERLARDGQAIGRWFLLFPPSAAHSEQRGRLSATLEALSAEG